jgi:Family of unknown function (DUF6328)
MTDREDRKKRVDRELIELLNELRVALPGVQVLFAFLLTVPFTPYFLKITDAQKNVYFAAFLTASVATALFIAPTAYHRIRFREGDKEQLLQTANRLALLGTVFLAASISCVVFVITDILFGGAAALITTALNVVLFTWLWYVLPFSRHLRDANKKDKKSS